MLSSMDAGSVTLPEPLAPDEIVQRMVPDMRTGLIGRIELDIKVPPEFPEKYRASLVRSAELCAVKKHIEQPPAFQIYTKEVELAT